MRYFIQVEELINSLSEMDESCTSEVVVQQEDESKQIVTLQELSDFDPCLLTHVKATLSESSGDPEQVNSFSLQVSRQFKPNACVLVRVVLRIIKLIKLYFLRSSGLCNLDPNMHQD